MRGLIGVFLSWFVAGLMLLAPADIPAAEESSVGDVVLAIHGGEGDIDEEKLTKDEVKKYRETLAAALTAGLAAMKKGDSSLDGVEAAIRVMEGSGLFDAGLGTVLDHDGHATLDASIMNGKDHRAGAVAGVTTVKHPISAARAVMERTGHVLLVGPGADRFALRWVKNDIIPPEDFVNKNNWKQLQDEWSKQRDKRLAQANGGPAGRLRYGTVGAVALWKGNLAAGTSTGGLTDKLPGRVGDSPIIGAGTFADNDTCAVSCTGIGEYFIRYGVARDVSARMKYQQINAEQATEGVIEMLKKIELDPKSYAPAPGGGVEGGLIVLSKDGKFTARYNATQMTRGYIKDDGKPPVVTLFDAGKK